MKQVLEPKRCCGCHTCMNVCPTGAIRMQEDKRGFLYPVILQTKCIDCGLCQKRCPVLKKQDDMVKNIKAYACFNKNIDERLNSSSGGIFILLAKEIIKRRGVVFGASFDENFEVKHFFVEKKEDLNKFMGSKYTQSTIGNAYKKVKEFLDSGRYVLFTGTPCQTEGLKLYLNKDYDKLYIQDIICHGVPSPKVWRKYIEYQKNINKEEINSISFRNKENGWSSSRMKITFGTRTYTEERKNDIFMQAFLKNICLRDSCYNCSFKSKYRNSDITLADYWGIQDIHPEMNDNKGTSLVIVNTEKGNNLFNMIKNEIECIETNIDEALKFNSAMITSAKHCINEKEFINNIDNMNIDKLVRKYVPYFPTAPLYRKVINKIKTRIKSK